MRQGVPYCDYRYDCDAGTYKQQQLSTHKQCRGTWSVEAKKPYSFKALRDKKKKKRKNVEICILDNRLFLTLLEQSIFPQTSTLIPLKLLIHFGCVKYFELQQLQLMNFCHFCQLLYERGAATKAAESDLQEKRSI